MIWPAPEMFTPLAENVPPRVVTFAPTMTLPPPVLSLFATRPTFRRPTVVMLAELIVAPVVSMLLCAESVSVASAAPAVFARFAPARNVMLPAPAPPAPVVTVTFPPAFSALLIRFAPSCAPTAFEVQFGPATQPVRLTHVPAVVTIWTSNGSISHSPPRPAGAVTSGVAITSSDCLPEVSMKPPLPLRGPPRAASEP